MADFESSAFPVVVPGFIYGDGSSQEPAAQDGLTKREYFAAAVLAGLLSGTNKYDTPRQAAAHAVVCADALIAALNAIDTPK